LQGTTMIEPKVSVIIISYNRAPMLGWTIQSVIRQTYSNLEVVIVDASEDEQAKHVARTCAFTREHKWGLAQCCFNFKYVEIKNTGIADACNTGVKSSTGEFLIFLHDDNWIEPTYVEKVVALATDGIGIVSTDMHVFSNTEDSVVKTGPVTLDILKNENVIHASSLLRREAFDQTGGNKEDVYEDWELWLNVVKHEWQVRNVDEPLFHYRKAENSAITQYKERHEERVRNMRKIHGDIYG